MESIFLLQEDGTKLKQESSTGNNDFILLDIVMGAAFASMRSMQQRYPIAMDDQRVL
jgi:hypothetical protein